MKIASLRSLNRTIGQRFGEPFIIRNAKKIFNGASLSLDEIVLKLSLDSIKVPSESSTNELEAAILDRQNIIIDFLTKNCFDNHVVDFFADSYRCESIFHFLKTEPIETIKSWLCDSPSIRSDYSDCKALMLALNSLEAKRQSLSRRDICIIIEKASLSQRLLAAQKSGYKRLLDSIIAKIDLTNIILAFRYSKINIGTEAFFEEFVQGGVLTRDLLWEFFSKSEKNLKKLPFRYRQLVLALINEDSAVKINLEIERVLYSVINTKSVLTMFVFDSFVSRIWSLLCDCRLALSFVRQQTKKEDKDSILRSIDSYLKSSGRIAFVAGKDSALMLSIAGVDVFRDGEDLALRLDKINKSYDVIFVEDTLIGKDDDLKIKNSTALIVPISSLK